ncbi:hypothetical protein ABBQ32_000191 [Trebouxia sp. C0010 RCD-2024]
MQKSTSSLCSRLQHCCADRYSAQYKPRRHVVLDPNNMQTGSRLVSIGQIKICRDQSMLAYTVDTGDGSEVYDAVISIIGVAGQPGTVHQLSDVVSIEWAGTDALVYTQPDALGRPYKVMLHRLGQQQAADRCILQEDQPDCFLELATTSDGAYITINSNAKTASEVHLLSTSNPSNAPRVVQRRIPGLEYFLSHHRGHLIILTNARGAVNYQLMSTPSHEPSLPNWRTLVPEREGIALRDMEVFAGHAVLYENQGMQPAVSVLSLPCQPETASLMPPPQKQAASTLHASPLACRNNQNGFCANKQVMHGDVLSATGGKHPLQPGAVPQQRADLQPLEQPPASQQQNYREPDLHQRSGLDNTQQSTQSCSQQERQQQQQQQQHSSQDTQPVQSGGAHLQTIPMPPWVMSVEAGANLDYHSSTVRLKMASPVRPQHVFDYHLDTGQLQQLAVEHIEGHDPEDYMCHVLYASSHDGTQVPMTIVHKRGLKLDGSHPTLVTVYGAYGECLETGFEAERLSLLERGWVVALAHVRGGGELGRRWHAAGQSTSKMNSVLDLEACLDHLLHKGYTRKGLVALQGTSAGGLLVAALLNRRPQDLLAAILRVPFVDMFTCMTRPELPLTVHEYGEWGNPADPKVLLQMRKLCPYQNVARAQYPPVMATCAVPDSRVPVWCPAKWVAKIRQHQTADPPVLLLHTLDTGHFAHESDLLENSVLEYSFLLDALHKT